MNLKISTSLLALGTFTSAVLLNLTPVSAQRGNGSNNGNGSNTTNAIQFLTATITANVVAAVNTALSQILAANPSALSNATSNASLLPPGASASVAAAAADLQKLVAGFSAGNVTAAQLNAAIGAYNAYVEALVASLGGADAVAFLSSSGADKALDATNTPGVRGLLLALSARATGK